MRKKEVDKILALIDDYEERIESITKFAEKKTKEKNPDIIETVFDLSKYLVLVDVIIDLKRMINNNKKPPRNFPSDFSKKLFRLKNEQALTLFHLQRTKQVLQYYFWIKEHTECHLKEDKQ